MPVRLLVFSGFLSIALGSVQVAGANLNGLNQEFERQESVDHLSSEHQRQLERFEQAASEHQQELEDLYDIRGEEPPKLLSETSVDAVAELLSNHHLDQHTDELFPESPYPVMF